MEGEHIHAAHLDEEALQVFINGGMAGRVIDEDSRAAVCRKSQDVMQLPAEFPNVHEVADARLFIKEMLGRDVVPNQFQILFPQLMRNLLVLRSADGLLAPLRKPVRQFLFCPVDEFIDFRRMVDRRLYSFVDSLYGNELFRGVGHRLSCMRRRSRFHAHAWWCREAARMLRGSGIPRCSRWLPAGQTRSTADCASESA